MADESATYKNRGDDISLSSGIENRWHPELAEGVFNEISHASYTLHIGQA